MKLDENIFEVLVTVSELKYIVNTPTVTRGRVELEVSKRLYVLFCPAKLGSF